MKRFFLYGLYTLIILVVGSAFAFKVFQPVQVLPRIRLAPGFLAVDQDGERLTNEDLRGQFVLYNFTYTNCSTGCEQMNQTMREIQNQLDTVELGDIDVSLVTISFDPERDTPKALQAYAQSVGADPAVWRFVTLSDPTMMKFVIGGGFETYYEANEDGSFSFDPAFVLVDGWGIIRGEYRYQTMTPDSERILRHLGVLAEEVINSQGVNSVAYEAAHYFLCYAP
ncbi:MAG: SCO family protein [Ardenticatenaceae bacterium]|nr:SCO family protein [Ardenticatenaceae bacterium]MCB9445784.1 SCO family protein [Ardenticatenaceae bacterium]